MSGSKRVGSAEHDRPAAVVVSGRVRVAGSPCASVLLVADLVPGSRSFVDRRGAVPVLVVDTGYAELHVQIPAARLSLDDVRIADDLLESVVLWRTALIALL